MTTNQNENEDKYANWVSKARALLSNFNYFRYTYSDDLNLHFTYFFIINALTNPTRMFLHNNSKGSHLLQDNEIDHGSMVGHKNLLDQEWEDKQYSTENDA